jgi:hypothetical protein
MIIDWVGKAEMEGRMRKFEQGRQNPKAGPVYQVRPT